jgi:hypothetical protein
VSNGRATQDRAATPNDRAVAPHEPSGMARGYARSRERDAAARDALVPLAPGERPWPITLSAVLAALFAVANLVLILSGWEVDGERPVAGGLVFVAVMLAAAIGMWRLKYWAVLGFEVLLGLIVLVFSLFLLRASNVLAVVVCVPIIAVAGWLFWKLVRVMGRIQTPQRVR